MSRTSTIILWLLALGPVLSACGGGVVRFQPGPAIESVDDMQDIDEPKEKGFDRFTHHGYNFFNRQIREGLDPVPAAPAEDVNRLGQVPDSSWFVNRVSGLTAADVARGPGGDDPGPEDFKPWKVVRFKVGGQNPGLVIEDTRGARFIIKLDKPGTPVIATSAGAVAARLFWACGYHVPDDRLVFFELGDLVMTDRVREEAKEDRENRSAEEIVREMLDALAVDAASGGYRALTSRYLPGLPVGGFSYRGTRGDDPNDRIPHQNRRSLRGLRVFAAWLNHVDVKIDNTLDLYTEVDGRRFLRHYLVDFDGCLGGYWAARQEQRIGFAYDVDLGEFATGLVGLGIPRRPYENLDDVPDPLIGLFEAEVYDPAGWTANYVNPQVLACNRADAYWAADVLARLDEDHIAAAVSLGRYRNPETDALLLDILRKRWEKTVDWGLRQVTPVTAMDNVVESGGELRVGAEDALEHYGRTSDYRYRVEILDREGKRLEHREIQDTPAVRLESSLLEADDYLVVRWTAVDGDGHELPPSEGHYARTGTGWVLLGILRDGQ
jgi:hypothetical protein